MLSLNPAEWVFNFAAYFRRLGPFGKFAALAILVVIVGGAAFAYVRNLQGISDEKAAKIIAKYKAEHPEELEKHFPDGSQGIKVTPNAVVPVTPPQPDVEIHWAGTKIERLPGDEVRITVPFIGLSRGREFVNCSFRFPVRVGDVGSIPIFGSEYRLAMLLLAARGPDVVALVSVVRQ